MKQKKTLQPIKQKSRQKTTNKKPFPISEEGHKKRFDQLLDDAVFSVNPK